VAEAFEVQEFFEYLKENRMIWFFCTNENLSSFLQQKNNKTMIIDFNELHKTALEKYLSKLQKLTSNYTEMYKIIDSFNQKHSHKYDQPSHRH